MTLLPTRLTSSWRALARPFSASCRTRTPPSTEYPYSSTARVLPSSPSPPRTTSLLTALNTHLSSSHPLASSLLPLFSRRSPTRLLPGSILTVSSYSVPPSAANPNPPINTFSGVLIAVRRRHAGQDTSFRLRNMVGRTGVEVAYKVLSPLLADIKIVSRATKSGVPVLNAAGHEVQRKPPALRAAKRAKLYFVRDQPDRLTSVGGIVKQQKEREAQAASAASKRRR